MLTPTHLTAIVLTSLHVKLSFVSEKEEFHFYEKIYWPGKYRFPLYIAAILEYNISAKESRRNEGNPP